MFCKYCGKQIDDNANFCDYCGRSLSENPPIVNGNTRTKLNKKATAIGLIVFAVVGIFFVITSDKLIISSNEKKISVVQNAHFEFLPDITIGELLNNTHHGLNSSAEMWLYDSANDKVEFWGYSNSCDTCMIIDFSEKVKNGTPTIITHKINFDKINEAETVDNEMFQSYILDLYSLYKGVEKTSETSEMTTQTTTKTTAKTTKTTAETTTKTEKTESYDVYFSIDDIISASGVNQSDWGLYEINDLLCDNGVANADIEVVGSNITVNNVTGVNVSGAYSRTVTISGTIKSIHVVTRENAGIVNAFDNDSKYFSVTKTVGDS